MSTFDQINELKSRRQVIENGGQTKVVSARDRIDSLLDTDSFVELGAFVKHRSTNFNMLDKNTPADGVVTGYGTIEGRLVYVYSQDATVLGGSVGEMHAKKIVEMYKKAMQMGAPVIGLLDSNGLRLQELTDGLNGYGEIFMQQSLASGVIPQITVVIGNCAGGATLIPGISDFTFAVESAKVYMNSPNAMIDKENSLDISKSAKLHGEKSGLVDFVCKDEEVCFNKVRSLIDLLPANNIEDAPMYETNDDLNRVSDVLNQDDVNVKTLINEIADNNKFFEVKENYAKNIIVGFIRLNGGTIGIVANNSLENEGLLNTDACEKAMRFINFCDAFNIPLVTLTDVEGFEASIKEEFGAISRATSKLVYAYSNATVPKVNVIFGNAYGTAYITMNSKHIGADVVYAWPNAKISVMNSESAVKIMYADEISQSDSSDILNDKINEFDNIQASVYSAASRGYVDDIIEPSVTRKRIIIAIEMLISKRQDKPAKKHGTVL